MQEIAIPAGLAPRAVALQLAPRPGQPPFTLEAWIEAPGRAPVRLGAIAPYPPGEPGEFRLAWPAAFGAPPAGSKLRLEFKTEASVGQPGATVTVVWLP